MRNSVEIPAGRVSRKVLEKIGRGFSPGSVSGVFGRSLNIGTGDGFLIHIGEDGLPLTPRSIAIPGREFSLRLHGQIRAGEHAFGAQGCIYLPDSRISVSCCGAPVFEPKLHWPADSRPLGEIGRDLVETMRFVEGARPSDPPPSPLAGYFLNRVADSKGMRDKGDRLPPKDGEEPAVSTSLTRSLWTRIDSFLRAVAGKQGGDLREITRGIIGLGPGLTPSGDDFLAAFVSVAAAMGKGPECAPPLGEALGKILIEESKGRTTVISAAMFEDAARGEMNEPALLFVSSLLRGKDPREAQARALDLVSMGAFSGEDFLNGTAAALIVLGRRARKSPAGTVRVRRMRVPEQL